MKLPELPSPSRVETFRGTTLISWKPGKMEAYGIKCAEAMREACIKRLGSPNDNIAEVLRTLEIET